MLGERGLCQQLVQVRPPPFIYLTRAAICLITWKNNVIFIYTLNLIDGDMIGAPSP